MRRVARLFSLNVPLLLACVAGCSDGDKDRVNGKFEHAYATASIVFGDEGETSYVSLLPDLEPQEVSLDTAREIPGWAGVWTNAGKLFVSDGESPLMWRYDVSASGQYSEEGKISFANYGLEYADGAFVSEDKVYAFADEVVVWNPKTMKVTGSFPLPEIEDKERGLEWSRLSTGRSFAVRGNRAYVATNWANWDEYDVAEDSLIVVIDTDKDEVIDTLSVPCPYLDVATVTDDGYVYFSNWIYSVGPTLLHGRRKACAARIAPGKDQIDPDWSLTFADVTGGREGGVLRYLGDNKAVFVAYHDELVEDLASYDSSELADLTNWRFWIVDLETLEASPLEGVDWSVGGYYSSRVDGRLFLFVPEANWESTAFYEVLQDGTTELRWTMDGWSLGLYKIR